MAEIPSGIASSAAQASNTARDVAEGRDARRGAAGGSDAAGKVGEVVETDDQDMATYADAEGSGSAGRPFGEEPAEEGDRDDAQGADGITQDEDGQMHLDLEA